VVIVVVVVVESLGVVAASLVVISGRSEADGEGGRGLETEAEDEEGQGLDARGQSRGLDTGDEDAGLEADLLVDESQRREVRDEKHVRRRREGCDLVELRGRHIAHPDGVHLCPLRLRVLCRFCGVREGSCGGCERGSG